MVIHTIKRNDTRPYFQVELIDGYGQEVSLAAGDTVRFTMTDSSDNRVKVERQLAVFVVGTGNVEYQWQVGDTDTVGFFDAEWEVTYADGTVETFPAGHFDAVEIVGDLA